MLPKISTDHVQFAFGGIVAGVAVLFAFPQTELPEFHAGTGCIIAVSAKTCPNGSMGTCASSHEKCNHGTTKNALSCNDGQGTESNCESDPNCADIKNADYDDDCTDPWPGSGPDPE